MAQYDMMVGNMPDVRRHFNSIAKDYEAWKTRNAYYYHALKKLFRTLVPAGKHVLEIGCGTGDILAAVEPANGIGVDISEEMITRAKQKYADIGSLRFLTGSIDAASSAIPYDYIILSDVLEHLENQEDFFSQLNRLAQPSSQVIISVANPLWEPILLIAEMLGLKMPEGPHHRQSLEEVEELFQRHAFSVLRCERRLLIPINLPGSDYLNKFFEHFPFLRALNFIVCWVILPNES